MVDYLNLSYDQEGDILELKFSDLAPTVGVELSDNIVFHYNRETRTPVRIMFIGYSKLIQLDNLTLDGLDDVSDEIREEVLDILFRRPVNRVVESSGAHNRIRFSNPRLNDLVGV